MLDSLKRGASFFIVLVGFSQSLILSRQSLNGENFYSTKQLLNKTYRAPTSLKQSLQQMDLNPYLLLSSNPLKMLSLAELKTTKGSVELKLGHFSSKDGHGDPVFACQIYDRIVLHYQSSESSYSSESSETIESPSSSEPQMELEVPCQISRADVRYLESIKFNPVEILKSEPTDGTYRLNEQSNVSAQFNHINGRWPSQWFLKSAQLVDSKKNRPNLEISALSLSAEKRKLLQLQW